MLMKVNDPAQGARNLLCNCAEARPGERVLIAYEPDVLGHYATDAVRAVREAGEDLGLDVALVDVGFRPHAPRLVGELRQEMARADIVVFLARLGDQLRFSEMPQGQRIIVSYALDGELFASRFATTHHRAMVALKETVDTAFRTAQIVRVTCAAGTDFAGRPAMPEGKGADTTIRRFPMSVFQPVPAHSFSGRVALCGFLTGTGSLYYDDYTLEFAGPVHALFRDGRLTSFEGAASDVALASAHYDAVSERFGIDRDHIHSWHAGLHPGCGYGAPARANYERWGSAAFGNPRLLHFHTCGQYAPGEISWNMLDPTIEIDGVPVWENGVFHAERLAGGAEILAAYPCAAEAFAHADPRCGL
ncbi:MAG: hypothetical protein AAF646_01995 [Pseudomonadota bacterium]